MSSNQALLVIDMQQGLFELKSPVHDGDVLLWRVNDLVSRAREANVPVIYIYHCGGTERHPLYPDKSGWQLHPALTPPTDDLKISKTAYDSFKKTSLKAELDAREIRTLIIAGLQTELCINATSLRAVQLGYTVQLVKDAHSTFDSKKGTAEEIIAEHHQTLSEAGVQLVAAADIEFN